MLTHTVSGGYASLLNFTTNCDQGKDAASFDYYTVVSLSHVWCSVCSSTESQGERVRRWSPAQAECRPVLARGLLLSSMSSSFAQSRVAPQSETKVKGRGVNTHTPSLPHPSPPPSPPASATPLLFVSLTPPPP